MKGGRDEEREFKRAMGQDQGPQRLRGTRGVDARLGGGRRSSVHYIAERWGSIVLVNYVSNALYALFACFPLVSLVVVEWCGVGIGGVVRYLLQATQRAQRGEIRVDLKMQDVRENQIIKILQ